MRWLRFSLAAQALLALYFQAIQWLPLGRWNYQPGFRPFLQRVAQGDAGPMDALPLAAFLLPVALFWLAYAKNIRWLMWAGVAGYSMWLAMQVRTWWGAYIFGASDRWMATYQRVFSKSTQLLPAFGRHLPPDGMHLVLQLLLLLVVVSAIVGLIQTRNAVR